MDNEHIIFWGRTVERLLIVGFSGASLVLGWSLFKLRILKDQTAELASKNWTIRLEKVGPGIFFALFGVLSLMFAVSHPLEVKELDRRPRTLSQELDISYAGGRDDTLRDEMQAINSLEQVAVPPALAHPNPGEKQALDRAVEILNARKSYLLQVQFGDNAKRYERLRKAAEANPSALKDLSPSEADAYRKIDQFANATLLGSGR